MESSNNKLIGRIVALGLILLFLSPVIFVSLKEYRHRKAAAARPPEAPAPVFAYTVTVADSSEKGYILTAPYRLNHWRHGMLAILDLNGKLVYEQKTRGAIYDFRPWVLNGKTYYSYFVNDTASKHIKKVGIAAGHIVILDSALNEVRQIHLKPFGNVLTNEHQNLDPHDIILLDEQHYYTMVLYERHVDNIPAGLKPAPYIKVAVPVIQEVKDDKVVWQWEASNYPEFYGNSVEHNKYGDTSLTQDYMHINSMSIDPRDSNLIVSFRTQDQVIKIDHKTGAILWRLGGKTSDFALMPDQKFLRQHNAKIINTNTLMLFDNGDSTLRRKSRVLEFVLDEKNKKVASFHAFDVPEAFSQFMGSVDKYGDDYFICGGSGNYILQINSITGKKKFELLDTLAMYRAYKVPRLPGFTH